MIRQVRKDFPDSSLGALPYSQEPLSAQEVQNTVKLFFDVLQFKIWEYDPFLLFLDEKMTQSPLSKLYFRQMNSQVSAPAFLVSV